MLKLQITGRKKNLINFLFEGKMKLQVITLIMSMFLVDICFGQTLIVPGTGQVISSEPLVAGKIYKIQAEGTYTYDNKGTCESCIADTEWWNNYDYLRFYIDCTEQDKWSGSQDWAQQTYTITAGEHTFKWSYTKDSSVSSGSDCGWIDLITLY